MEEVVKALTPAAERLGAAAERIWPQMILMTQVRGWFVLAFLAVAVFGVLWVTRRGHRYLRDTRAESEKERESNRRYDSDDMGLTLAHFGFYGIAGLVWLILFWTVGVEASLALQRIFAPEAMAILDLAKSLK